MTLHVHELPLNYYDILSVDIGSVECSLIESSFVSGKIKEDERVMDIKKRERKLHYLYLYSSLHQLPLCAYIFIGSAISCVTGPTLHNGLYNISLSLNISGELVIIDPNTQFLYEDAKVATIVPVWGPIAGGTLLTITGSYLYIGNTSLTYVLVAGRNCTIM